MRPRLLPAILSSIRVPASLALVTLYDPHPGVGLWTTGTIVALIVASDIADGRLARRRAAQSIEGYVLDGWGDRAFHVAIYLILFQTGLLPLAAVWALVFREITVYAARANDPNWFSSQSRWERLTNVSYAGIVRLILILEILRADSHLPVWYASYRAGISGVLLLWNCVSYIQQGKRFIARWRGLKDA